MSFRNPLDGVAPETALVLGSLRQRFHPDAEALADLTSVPLDADRVLTTARRHAVTPQLLTGLSDHLDRLPADIATRLESLARNNRLRSLDLAGELVGMIDGLREAGVRALAYKGPVAAATLYDDLGAREFVDLDLLVRPTDVGRALGVLETRGYAPWIPVTDRQLAFLLRVGHDRKLVRDDNYVTELQWAIAERSFRVPRGVDGFFSRARGVSVGGREVPTLSRLDEALVLAIHGALHLWGRLAWVLDVALALGGLTDDEAAMVLGAAERAGIRRLFLSGPAMARALFDAPIPASLRASLDADERLARIADDLVGWLLGPDGPTIPTGREALRARLALKDSAMHRGTEALRIATTPTLSDWHAVRLPDVLWPLYYPVRLGRLFGSYVAGNRAPGDWLRDEDPEHAH